MRKRRPRSHNEWMTAVERGGRKSCTYCHEPLGQREWIWSWSVYINANKRLIRDFCKSCWPELAERLVAHEKQCPDNCTIHLQVHGAPRPWWMVLPRVVCVIPNKRAVPVCRDAHSSRLAPEPFMVSPLTTIREVV